MSDALENSEDLTLHGAFSAAEKKNSHSPFRELPGWTFDEGLWAGQEPLNRAFTLPLASDIDMSNIPKSFIKSGIADPSALELEEVVFLGQDSSHWVPGVIPGAYNSQKDGDYLHSSLSCLEVVGQNRTFSYLPNTDEIDPLSVRSRLDLAIAPAMTKPIAVRYLTRGQNLQILPGDSFLQVSKFTGLSSAGVELDGDLIGCTDQTKNEFKITRNESDLIEALPLLIDENATVSDGVLTVTLEHAPVSTRRVVFSRIDLFRRELPFYLWHAKRHDPTQSLSVGDYTIGYKDNSGEGAGVLLYLGEESPLELGTITYKPAHDVSLEFNKDVRIEEEELLTMRLVSENREYYFLPRFPALDLSGFDDELLVGNLTLDTESIVVTIDGEQWTRVSSLEELSADDPQNVFEFDPLWGILEFGNEGKEDLSGNRVWGNRPSEAPTVSWTRVPFVRYEQPNVDALFFDPSEDIDPLTNALKHGFLVLDTSRLTPWKIVLSTNAPKESVSPELTLHGKILGGEFSGIEIPPTSIFDIPILRARVIAFGSPVQGVPNVPVEFICSDGLSTFTQASGVTDGEGYVYTEMLGKSNFGRYVLTANLFQESETAGLNPIASDLVRAFSPLGPIVTSIEPNIPTSWNGIGDEWTNNALVVEEFTQNDLEDIYLFVVSTPGENTLDDYDDDPLPGDEYLTPYDPYLRTGGLIKVWSKTEDEAQRIVHPIEARQVSATQTILIFDREMPSGQLVMGYQVVIDRNTRVYAKTNEAPILTSNELVFSLTLNDTMKGQWRLPILQAPDADDTTLEDPEAEDFSGSRIGTATYISPNDYYIAELRDSSDEVVTEGVVGMLLDIIGENFGEGGEGPSVYIVKLSESGEVEGVKDITAFTEIISASRIRIAELPSPPTEELGEYKIAVSSTSEHTSKQFTFIG
jgi:hypothetical protein